MESLAFDTHRFVKNLTSAGMPEPQAEVLAQEQVRLIEANLATKRDVGEIKRDIAELRLQITSVEQRMTLRLGSLMAAGIAILAALIGLF